MTHKGCEIMALHSKDGWRALVLYGIGPEDFAFSEHTDSRVDAEQDGIKLADNIRGPHERKRATPSAAGAPTEA